MNTTDLTPLPVHPNLEQYKKQAKDLAKACRAGSAVDVQRVRKYHPRAAQLLDSSPVSAKFALADAQLVLACEHGFESWPKFAKHIASLARANSSVSLFESAAEAVVAGDAKTLSSLLRENPGLVQERSARVHRATLLHYVGANGLENYRQKTPKNAVEIARILLNAGAEVDAMADAYGGSTPLGLVATSIHPARAGIQIALLETLLNHGASIDGPAGTWSPLISALHNGRPHAAEYLAQRGARLDLEGAAGVGRVDVVKSFFSEDGGLKVTATRAQMVSGFMWACEYGRSNVVEYLLQGAVDVNVKGDDGQTGLHWAAIGGQIGTMKLLLQRNAPLEMENTYGGTPLGQALWCVINGDSEVDYLPVVETLIHAGAQIQPEWLTWLAQQKGQPSPAVARVRRLLERHMT